MNNLLDIRTPAEGEASARKADYGLANHGLANVRKAYWNLPGEALYEEIAFRREARIVAGGPVVAHPVAARGRAA